MGYGMLALDMLGHGGTGKPADPAADIPRPISRDIADVVDAERPKKVIAIGYGW
ncbi:uncharacterized protein PHACADRAFT_253535 [Phanerochaete carnosa HHB-10118-sp]|uniref:AB hydrolase-1 domain-containing protein n=1 Tax=Phanerochaete carnosa (strain HHB-10118-sp) TaxID=650164 RepID=K5VXY3_PHACS|nr:uncharacterized protein PHACADRAFT_253535 [Phanerochaete carnosa HHB-10118-sp]EKM56428.1 hypothetical protein PHACADRAFT_253535 [Phanerochaete carnosa HHB-10118-sp]